MKTTENKDAYSTPDYERMTFETSDLMQQSEDDPTRNPYDINEDDTTGRLGAVNFF